MLGGGELNPYVDPLEQALELAREGRAAEKRRALTDALSAYERAHEVAARLSPTPLLANVLRWMGSVHRHMGDTGARGGWPPKRARSGSRA